MATPSPEDVFYWAIGLMSGTSRDGIDAALIYTNGKNVQSFGESVYVPYEVDFQMALESICFDGGDPEEVKILEEVLTHLHVLAVKKLLKKSKMTPAEVRVIGFHGHTLWHKSPRVHGGKGATCQMGDGALLARETGIDVVCDFRSADMAAGGEGAPLVPIYHQAVFEHFNRLLAAQNPKAVQPSGLFINIGGVANITCVQEGAPEQLIAFDTGPGGCLLDFWVQSTTDNRLLCDKNGQLAAAGEVDLITLGVLMSHCHTQVPPPKSFDRGELESFFLDDDCLSYWDLKTGAATLTMLTAQTIIEGVKHLPVVPRVWFLCGGGRKNPTLLEMIKNLVQDSIQETIHIIPLSATKQEKPFNVDGDMVEAQAFAYLAARHLGGLPLSFPGTTGVKVPQCGGRLYPSRGREREEAGAL